MSALKATTVELQYGRTGPVALRGLSLTLDSGELVGIVGPNGSGKSTLVRALSRALKPGTGSILLNGTDLYGETSAREAAKGIGVVQQETGEAFGFTVRDVVLMGRSPHIPRRPFSTESAHDHAIADEAMRVTGVETLADRLMVELSGGERQRVVLARALAQEPGVILLDEPTAHLDLKHQREVLAIVKQLSEKMGRAVLAVLHDLNLAAAYCDRLVLMKDGAVLAQGTVSEVLTQENVKAAYGTNVWVRCHPITGTPVLITLPDLPVDIPVTGPSIHVICGGGSGTGIFVALRQKGYSVTSAVLNEGDTDAESATMLGVPFVRESPFSVISEAAALSAAQIGKTAAAVVVTDAPFGPANLANLLDVAALQKSGKPIFLLSTPDISDRDFTNGTATGIWRKIAAAGATQFETVQQLLDLLG